MQRTTAILGLAALLLATDIRSAWAQGVGPPCMQPTPCQPPGFRHETPRWQGHSLALGINMALGGLSAGIVRAARGDSFRDGFYRGAAGGGIAYLGKYITTTQTPGIALVGRQTAAFGASITRSALTGSGPFDRLSFPLGPVWIHRSDSGTKVTLDLPTVAGTIYGLTREGSRFDLGRSLATGAVVFQVDHIRRQGTQQVLGTAIGGAILYRPDPHLFFSIDEIMAHEVIHVLQHDYVATAISSPFEGWLSGRLPGPLARPLRYLDLGSYMLLWALPGALGVASRDAPWEREAYFMVPGPPAWH